MAGLWTSRLESNRRLGLLTFLLFLRSFFFFFFLRDCPHARISPRASHPFRSITGEARGINLGIADSGLIHTVMNSACSEQTWLGSVSG